MYMSVSNFFAKFRFIPLCLMKYNQFFYQWVSFFLPYNISMNPCNISCHEPRQNLQSQFTWYSSLPTVLTCGFLNFHAGVLHCVAMDPQPLQTMRLCSAIARLQLHANQGVVGVFLPPLSFSCFSCYWERYPDLVAERDVDDYVVKGVSQQ